MLAASIATNLVCVMQDGMDQAKFCCPRVQGLESKSKLFSQLYRPRLHVAATWVHGRRFHVAVSDEDMPKDAVCEIEQLSRALDALFHDVGGLPSSGLELSFRQHLSRVQKPPLHIIPDIARGLKNFQMDHGKFSQSWPQWLGFRCKLFKLRTPGLHRGV